MSLTTFIGIKDVTTLISPLRPKMPRKIGVPLKVEPRSNRYALVGTAFDYLLRFELQRLAPHAISTPWVAEHAPKMIWNERDDGLTSYLSLEKDDNGLIYLSRSPTAEPDPDLAEKVGNLAHRVVEEAKLAVETYTKSNQPTLSEQANVASHAIRLAKLDQLVRSWQLDPTFHEVEAEDVEDMLEMLKITPFDFMIDSDLLLLNPTFGHSSEIVGGADADLITGDMLVDFKTTKRSEVRPKDLDQLLGYFFLARNQRRIDSEFPEIRRLALYFCRHGHLLELDTKTWADHPEFNKIETVFFKRAEKEKVFRRKT